MALILNGKAVAHEIRQELKLKVAELKSAGIVPKLGVILVGEHTPSLIYVTNKEKACQELGIKTEIIKTRDDIMENQLLEIIGKWNQDSELNGILVQMPLPKSISAHKILDAIAEDKDVDGLTATNLGRLLRSKNPEFAPCTPLGILELLSRYKIETESKHCVIVGRGELVGKPLANMLLNKPSANRQLPMGNATVTVLHSKTPDIRYFTLQGDILIVAIGQPKFIKKDMVKKGAIVIDVGVNRIINETQSPKIVGDVDFENVKEIACAITPVPGGVGPMTVTMLLKNIIQACVKQNKRNG